MQSSTNQSQRISILTGTITPNKYIENSQHFEQNSGILWILNLGSSILDPQSLGDHFKHSMFGSFDITPPPFFSWQLQVFELSKIGLLKR